MWSKYFREADALIYVIDCSSSIEEQAHSRAVFQDLVIQESLTGTPCMLIGNKCGDVSIATTVAAEWIYPTPAQTVGPMSFVHLPLDTTRWGRHIRNMCKWLVTHCSLVKQLNC